MTKIMVFNNFGDDRKNWINRISKQSPDGNIWNNIELTCDINECDYIVVLDGAGNIHKNDFTTFIKKDKIFLQREPEQVQGELRINKSKFVKYVDYNKHGTYVDWWLDYDYKYLSELKYDDVDKSKKNPICIVTSKSFTDGQRRRLNFLRKIQSKVDIDFYGKKDISYLFKNYLGLPEYSNTSKRDKSRIFEYDISISLENGSRENFFTRTSEDFLCWALPVYWGCPNLHEYFPENSYRYVDVDEDYTQEQLRFLMRKPEKKEIKAIAEARDLVLNKYNFFPYMESLLKEIK